MATHGNKRKDETPGTPDDQKGKRVKHAQADHESNLSEVEKQKQKAKDVFADLITQAEASLLSDESKKNISSQLEDGKVHPIVHALWIKKRLREEKSKQDNSKQEEFKGMVLAPNAGEPVEEGRSNKRHSFELDAEGENWKHAIQKNGFAAGTILDYQLRWRWSSRAVKFAVELLNASATMLGHGVEMTELPNTSFIDGYGAHPNLLTRSQTRGIVADCFQRIEIHAGKKRTGIVSAITGSPGIGKSWTLIYALQQALLYENAIVPLFLQKEEVAFLFMRREGKVFAWYTKTGPKADSELFQREEVLVLLDPTEAGKGGASFAGGARSLIYAASNNAAHFGIPEEQATDGVLRYLGAPTMEELKVMIPRISTTSVERAVERSKDVGRLPRYLIDDGLCDRRMEKTEAAIEDLRQQGVLEQTLDLKGVSRGENTIPGTLFSVEPSRIATDSHLTETSGWELCYEGGNMNFEERIVTVLTSRVEGMIIESGRRALLSAWGSFAPDELAKFGRHMEDLVWNDMTEEKCCYYKRRKMGRGRDEPKFVPLQSTEETTVEQPADMETAHWILKGLGTTPNKVVRMPPNFPVIDMAGPDRRLVQLTVGSDHVKPAGGMLDILISVGLLSIGKDTLVATKENDDVDFWWAVPPMRFREWCKKAATKYNKKIPTKTFESRLRELMKDSQLTDQAIHDSWGVFVDCFDTHVHQYCCGSSI